MAPPFLDEYLWIQIIRKFVDVDLDSTDWLPIRLVNRLFNQQILFTLFVVRPEVGRYNRSPCGYGWTEGWLTNRYSRLYDSWWLQGLLMQNSPSSFIASRARGVAPAQLLKWKTCVDEAAHLFLNHADQTKNNILEAIFFSGFLGSINSPSVKFQKVKELICDAYACLLGADNIHRDYDLQYFDPMILLDYHRFDWNKQFEWTGIDAFFLMTCYLGQLSAFERSLTLLKNQERDPEDNVRLHSAGLYVAIRQDSRSVTSSLLSSWSAMSNETWACALAGATAVGNLFMVQTLLSPKFSTGREELYLRSAIICASEFEEPIVRTEMLTLLFRHAREVSSWLIIEMLAYASRSNDIQFAKWVIETGKVDFYHHRITRSLVETRDHPLIVAVVNQNAGMVRFLLETKFKVHRENDKIIIANALKQASRWPHLDTFKALLPHVAHLGTRRVSSIATRIEHAVENVSTIIGPVDLNEPAFKSTEKSVGSYLVEQSVEYGTIGNLEWLLSRGCRTSEKVLVVRVSFSGDVATLTCMDRLLKSFSNPGIVVKCNHGCNYPEDISKISHFPTPVADKCTCRKAP